MKNTKTFKKNAKDLLATLMSEQNLTIIVKPGARTASINTLTKTITIPEFASEDENVYDMFQAHEISHAMHSDMVDIHRIFENDRRPGFQSYINITEDSRIERVIQDKFPGLKIVFKRAYKKLTEDGWFGVDPHDQETLDDMLLIDRVNLEEKSAGSFPVRFFNETETALLKGVQSAATYRDALNAAEKIYKYDEAAIQQKMDEAKNQQEDEGQDTPEDGEGQEAPEAPEAPDSNTTSDDADGEDSEDSEDSEDGGDTEDGQSGPGEDGKDSEDTEETEDGEDGEGENSEDGESGDDSDDSETSDKTTEDAGENESTKTGGDSIVQETPEGPESATDKAFQKKLDELAEETEIENSGDVEPTSYSLEMPQWNMKTTVVGWKDIYNEQNTDALQKISKLKGADFLDEEFFKSTEEWVDDEEEENDDEEYYEEQGY